MRSIKFNRSNIYALQNNTETETELCQKRINSQANNVYLMNLYSF